MSRVVKKDGKIVNLTVKEYDLLVLFLQNKNIALFRDRIYELVWQESYRGDSRTVDLHVSFIKDEKRISFSWYAISISLCKDDLKPVSTKMVVFLMM